MADNAGMGTSAQIKCTHVPAKIKGKLSDLIVGRSQSKKQEVRKYIVYTETH